MAAALFGCSLVGVLFVFTESRSTSAMTTQINSDIKAIQPELDAIKEEAKNVKQSLAPDQQRTLVSAHNLVARKRFAWSRLFADLETVIPRSVGVSQLAVRDVYQKDQQTFAELDFAVLSLDYQAVIAMISQMNESGIFRAELREQELQKGKGNVTEYKMRLLYEPRNSTPVRDANAPSVAENNQNEKQGAQ